MSTTRYRFDPISQSYDLLGPEERAANEYTLDPVTQQYIPLASGIRSLDGGDSGVNAPSGSSISMMSPGMAELGVGAQNLGLALSGIPSLTTQAVGAVSTAIGNNMMGSKVSPVSPSLGLGTLTVTPVDAIATEQEADDALATMMAYSQTEQAENEAQAQAVANAIAEQAEAEANEAASALSMSPGVATSMAMSVDAPSADAPAADTAADSGGGYGDNTTPGDSPSDGGPSGGDSDPGAGPGVGTGEKEGGLISIKKYAEGGVTMSSQPQYGFAPTMPSMNMPLGMMGQSMSGMMNPNMSGMMGQNMPQMNFREGGLASLSLPEMAERVQDAGRRGDTMLAHITPEEAGILQLLGGSGTINPETGQPEFFKKLLRKIVPKPIYKLGSFIGKGIESGVEKIAKDPILGPIAQIAAGYFGGPIGAALYAGLAPEGSSFNVKKAATAAALTAGAKAITNPGGNPFTPSYNYGSVSGGGASPTGTGNLEFDTSFTGTDAIAGDPISTLAPPPVVPSAAPPPVQITSGSTPPQPLPGDSSVFDFSRAGAPAPVESSLSQVGSAPAAATSAASGVGSLASAAGETALGYVKNMSAKDIAQTAFAGTQIAAGMEAKKELEQQKAEAEKVIAAQEKHTQEEIAFAKDVLRRYPVEYRRLTEEDVKSQNLAGGGLAGLNAFKAGGRPRFLKGNGDGMSDDIPAMIGKRQKAALSDGEFVIPADVVSHLGNGSSRAGAKKLYAMMDNIRQARTGKKRQAPEVKPDRYMPA